MDTLKQKALTLWGKAGPYKSLILHMIDAGAVAEVYLTEANRPLLGCLSSAIQQNTEHTVKLAGFLVACHDIGKAHPWFQLKNEIMGELPAEISEIIGLRKDTVVNNTNFRHEKYTPNVLFRIWSERRHIPEEVIEELVSVLADHHQKAGSYESVIPAGYQKEYEQMQDILEKELFSIFKPELSFDTDIDWSGFCEGLNGLLILSDWLSSDIRFHCSSDVDDNAMYYQESVEEAKKVISSIGFSKCSLPRPGSFPDLFGWNSSGLRPMQSLTEEVAAAPPMFSIIEDSPGSGKTEAALFLALQTAHHYGKTGLYFALPTAATANQMWERLNNIFSRYNIPDFRLIHGMAWSVIDDVDSQTPGLFGSEDEIGEEWLRASRRSLLSQFAVGTIDQVMMSVLTIRFRQLRMLGLTDKVLILDEVHAYDAYMSTVIDRMLEWCASFSIPVVMLSATLPAKKKEDYIKAYAKGGSYHICSEAYPLFTGISRTGELIQKKCSPFREMGYSVELVPYLNNLEKTAEKAIELIENGGNLCLMLNTIKDAQSIYKQLQVKLQKERDIQLLLYHAGYKAKDRRAIEEKCLALYAPNGIRPEKSILVCTQVVEQSLDVDFDILMTQICPIDLLIQRMGREWRHKLRRPDQITEPKTYILTGDVASSTMVRIYDPYILRNTEVFLRTRDRITVPNDLRTAITFVYDKTDDSTECYESCFNVSLMQTCAEGKIIGSPDPEEYYLVEQDNIFVTEDCTDHVRATTRLGEPTTRVILADGELVTRYRNNLTSKGIQREMLENSVSIPICVPFEQLENKGVLRGMLIAKGDENRYRITETVTVIYDQILGRIILRK